MSDHRIAFALHNYELEQTIIRLRNSRNRLIERVEELEEQNISGIEYGVRREAILMNLKAENSKLQALNRELSEIIAAP